MSPDPDFDAIKNAEASTSASDVRSLLGMSSYVSRLPNCVNIVAPLRELTHKGIDFICRDTRQKSLDQLKHRL